MGLVGVNVGSGQRRFESIPGVIEWKNVDYISREGEEPDVVADASDLPFETASCDFVVSHHCYEHVGAGEANPHILEAYRILRPGASLLVFVPDLKALAVRWLTGQLTDYLYMVNIYGAFRGDEGSRHKWGWSQAGLLTYLAEVAPFAEVKTFDWRVIPGASLAKDFWIASAECIK